MRYSSVSVAVLALASSVLGQFFDNILTPTRDQVLHAGVDFDITWAPEGVKGTIKITLLEGKTNVTLNPASVIKTGINNLDGKYTWKPTDDGFDTYGFFIEHEQNTTLSQYSQPFHIEGVAGSSTTTVKLSTGPSYTSTSTSSVASSTVTVVSTSTSANLTSSTALPTSNSTLSTTLTTPRTTATPTTTGAASASSSTIATPGAAVANLAKGGLAVVGGLVLAFAL